MGQYFRPVIINAAGEPISALNPRDYGAGDKIANHSRIGTPLMTAVEALLSLDGAARLVWAGDYDEPTPGEPGIYWLTEPHHLVRFAGLVDGDTVNRPGSGGDRERTRRMLLWLRRGSLTQRPVSGRYGCIRTGFPRLGIPSEGPAGMSARSSESMKLRCATG